VGGQRDRQRDTRAHDRANQPSSEGWQAESPATRGFGQRRSGAGSDLLGGSRPPRSDEPAPAPSSDDERLTRPGRNQPRRATLRGRKAKPGQPARRRTPPLGARRAGKGCPREPNGVPPRRRRARPARTDPPGPAQGAGCQSEGFKAHGSIEQRRGGNAESLATDSLAAQRPEVDGAGKTHWSRVATPGKGGRNPSPTARGYGPVATRGRAVREGKASKGLRHRGRQTEPPPSRREQRGQPETWRTPWPVAGCNRPAGC
jgi:hypothetical protein